jgi:hypothetical protein
MKKNQVPIEHRLFYTEQALAGLQEVKVYAICSGSETLISHVKQLIVTTRDIKEGIKRQIRETTEDGSEIHNR